MQKKALLFSAGNYLASSTLKIDNLSCVQHDIAAMEGRLTQIGFSVKKQEDAIRAEYIPSIQALTSNSPNDAVHVIYFSGHGGHSEGKNYIFPSDFGSIYDVKRNVDAAGIDIQNIIAQFRGKGRLILILDSCRSEFDISKGYYSEMASAENVYIAYGTMFEAMSSGMSDGLSWFTEAICDEILTPNIDVDTLFTRVRRNIQRKHSVQIPSSVNALLDSVVLHSVSDIDISDQNVYNFIKKYSDEYDAKYGPIVADDLIFIDAAQHFGISLLDAIWKFKKVDNKRFRDRGVKIPDLTEAEEKHIALQSFIQGKEFFTYDDSYTWYYNGRQIRMGEIPPTPPSLQQLAPEPGLELVVDFVANKECDTIHIKTTLPENCKVLVRCNTYKYSREMLILNGEILIKDASDISQVSIESGVFPLDEKAKQIIGTKCRNLTGRYIKFHPIFGNQINWTYKP